MGINGYKWHLAIEGKCHRFEPTLTLRMLQESQALLRRFALAELGCFEDLGVASLSLRPLGVISEAGGGKGD